MITRHGSGTSKPACPWPNRCSIPEWSLADVSVPTGSRSLLDVGTGWRGCGTGVLGSLSVHHSSIQEPWALLLPTTGAGCSRPHRTMTRWGRSGYGIGGQPSRSHHRSMPAEDVEP